MTDNDEAKNQYRMLGIYRPSGSIALKTGIRLGWQSGEPF